MKVSPDTRNKEGLTPLMWIIDCEYSSDLIDKYIKKSKDFLNIQDEFGNTALHYAYMIGDVVAVELLI